MSGEKMKKKEEKECDEERMWEKIREAKLKKKRK